MNRQEIISCLKQTEPAELKKLWDSANRVRAENVGQAVHLRGLVEFSNICGRKCLYCGINATNTKVQRYQMSKAEILDSAQIARKLGYGTVVLQSGENRKLDVYFLADVIKEIKQTIGLAITLSVGQWDREVYQLWKQAGADRFLMRFETGDDDLYRRLHPDSKTGVAERFDALRLLKELGYEVGSGVMLGLPGQSYQSLADDLLKFKQLELDMIGAGPYIKHQDTQLCKNLEKFLLDAREQVPATEEMTYKVIALARLLCPQANIPATTALATLNPKQGREQGLCCGANIVMPNVTLVKYRQMYEIYPAKACLAESAETCNACMLKRIESIGRHIGVGRGDSPGFLNRAQMGVGL